MWLTVSATAPESMVAPTSPTKLASTARMTAFSNVMERVPTASAIEFAASVDPFTKMVAATKNMVSARSGLDPNIVKNSGKDGMAAPLRRTAPTNPAVPPLRRQTKYLAYTHGGVVVNACDSEVNSIPQNKSRGLFAPKTSFLARRYLRSRKEGYYGAHTARRG